MNAWSNRYQLNDGALGGNAQNHGNAKWGSAQKPQSMFDYHISPSNYPAPTTSDYSKTTWNGRASTESNLLSSTRVSNSLANAPRLSFQARQAYGNGITTTASTNSPQLTTMQRQSAGEDGAQSPFYAGSLPVSRGQSHSTSNDTQIYSPLQRPQTIAPPAMHKTHINQTYKSSPRQQVAAATQYRAQGHATQPSTDQTLITCSSPRGQYAIDSQHRVQTPTSQPLAQPSLGGRALTQNYTPAHAQRSDDAHTQDGLISNNYSSTPKVPSTQPNNAPRKIPPLPLPVNQNHVSNMSQSVEQQQRPTYNNESSCTQSLEHTASNARSKPMSPQAPGSIIQDMRQIPHATSYSVAQTPTATVQQQYPGNHPQAKNGASYHSALGETRPSGEAKTAESALEAPAKSHPIEQTTSESQHRSNAANDRRSPSRRSPDVSSSVSKDVKETEEIDMAEGMKQIWQRMREWKTKDPALFQKLWEDMKKAGGSGTTQPARGVTLTPRPNHAVANLNQPAPQQLVVSQSPEVSTKVQSQPCDSVDSGNVANQRRAGIELEILQIPAGEKSRDIDKTMHKGKVDPAINASDASKLRDNPVNMKEPQISVTTAKAPPTNGGIESHQPRPENVLPEPRRSQPSKKVLHSSSQGAGKDGAKPTVPEPAAEKGNAPRQHWPGSTAMNQRAANGQPLAKRQQSFFTSNLLGSAVWPVAALKAAADVIVRVLKALDANAGKAISGDEIHALLEQTPTYVGVCSHLEKRGFVFNRGSMARHLMSCVPELSSPAAQRTARPQPASSEISNAPKASPIPEARSTTPAVSIPSGQKPDSQKTANSLSATSYDAVPAVGPKTISAPKARPKLNVPSPTIPSPMPGSKEANARKGDFSELVDLAQLSDDEDYVMPRQQARNDETFENGSEQLKPGLASIHEAPSNVPAGQSMHGINGPYQRTEMPALVKSDLQGQLPASRTPTVHPASLPSTISKRRAPNCIARPLSKADALRKSYYNPKTIARDILIAAGRHPAEAPLNAHLSRSLGKYIEVDSDLSTIDWDAVDPGGPPMPIVPTVNDSPHSPKRATGQKPSSRALPAARINMPQSVKHPQEQEIGVSRTMERDCTTDRVVRVKRRKTHAGESSYRETEVLPQVDPQGLRREPAATRTATSLSTALDHVTHAAQPGQLIVKDDKSTTPQSASSRPTPPGEIAAARTSFRAYPSSQFGHKMPPGRPPKAARTLQQSPKESTPSSDLTETRRRGRPPGAKNKKPSQATVKKAARIANTEISVPSQQELAEPDYTVYACEWRGCSAELHNLPTLRKHITKAHKLPDVGIEQTGQPCWWKGCRTLQASGDKILPRVTFNSTSDWMDHIESDHLYAVAMELGDGPSSKQTGKPKLIFEGSKYLFHAPSVFVPRFNPKLAAPLPTFPSSSAARTCSHTEPQKIARDRAAYLRDSDGRIVTFPSTSASIADYPADTLILSAVTMNAESNVPNRAFSKAHGNEKMDIRQSAIETLVAHQKHKERVGPGIDRGGCTLVNAERRATLLQSEGLARVVDGDY